VTRVAVAALLCLSVPRIAHAQDRDPLARTVTVRLEQVPIETALRIVADSGRLRLSYSSDLLPLARAVSISRRDTPVGLVLRDVLRGTDLDVAVATTGHVILVRMPGPKPVANTDAGSAARDAIGSLPVRPQLIDRVLVMGTPVAGARERELPNAVSVFSSERLWRARRTSLETVFHGLVPGVVAWDLGGFGPLAQMGSVRGSSSFSANYLKTYIDGVELASPQMLFAVDPSSIERIEVIRGPQGSALYGSDAISGVVHIVTKKGTLGTRWVPRADAMLSAGIVQSRYDEGRSEMQRHSLALAGGGVRGSYSIGGAYGNEGEYVRGMQSSTRGVFAGSRAMLGSLLLEGTAQHSGVHFLAPTNPLLRVRRTTAAQTAWASAPQSLRHSTFGITARYDARPWWQQSLVIGHDANVGALAPQRNPAVVADALLGATAEDAAKTSLRYSTTLQVPPANGASSSLTFGVEHSRARQERLGHAATILGPSTSTGLVSLYVDTVRNTGAFAQWKLDVRETFYFSAGLRGEENTAAGDGHTPAWAPMVGASVVRDVREWTVKVRGAYGRGLRPPAPGGRLELASQGIRQLANPDLGPETQSGIEGGVEVYSGDRLTLRATLYRQIAEGLIQHVLLDAKSPPRIAVQQQNAGKIENRGLELEGNAKLGVLRFDGGYSFTSSRVRAIAPRYTGELRPGDRVPEVPSSAGELSVTLGRSSLQATFGVSHIGAWTGYDWLRYYSTVEQPILPRPSLRSFWLEYPAITKSFATVSLVTPGGLSWFLAADNIGNVQRFERDNLLITAGRVVRAGVSVER
jgi:iron complex outermembrane recepter protein